MSFFSILIWNIKISRKDKYEIFPYGYFYDPWGMPNQKIWVPFFSVFQCFSGYRVIVNHFLPEVEALFSMTEYCGGTRFKFLVLASNTGIPLWPAFSWTILTWDLRSTWTRKHFWQNGHLWILWPLLDCPLSKGN